MSPSTALGGSNALVLYSIIMAIAVPGVVSSLVPGGRRPGWNLVLAGIAIGAATYAGMHAVLSSAPSELHRPLLDALFLLANQAFLLGALIRSRSEPGAQGTNRRTTSVHGVRRYGMILAVVFAGLFAGHVAAVLLDPSLVRIAFWLHGGVTAILALTTLWFVRGPGAQA